MNGCPASLAPLLFLSAGPRGGGSGLLGGAEEDVREQGKIFAFFFTLLHFYPLE
jgi:hypothetical protein